MYETQRRKIILSSTEDRRQRDIEIQQHHQRSSRRQYTTLCLHNSQQHQQTQRRNNALVSRTPFIFFTTKPNRHLHNFPPLTKQAYIHNLTYHFNKSIQIDRDTRTRCISHLSRFYKTPFVQHPNKVSCELGEIITIFFICCSSAAIYLKNKRLP